MIIFCFPQNGGGFIRWEKAEQELAETVAEWIISNCTDNGLYGIKSRAAVVSWSDKWSVGQQVRHFLLTQHDMKKFMHRWEEYITQPNWHDLTFKDYKSTPQKKTWWERLIRF